MPDEVRLRHARRLLARTPVNALLTLERDAAVAGANDRVWRPAASGSAIDLRHALERLAPGGRASGGRPRSRSPPCPATRRRQAARCPFCSALPRSAPSNSSPTGPGLQRGELAALLAVSGPRASQLTTRLEGFGLVARPIAGSGLPGPASPGSAGRRKTGRVALTDRGLAMLARRDRTSVGLARKRWSVAPLDDDAPYGWRNVSGGRSRQLLRNVEHTEAVHGFVAALARQARALGWEIAQIDPPGRASRHFRHEGGLRSVHPDAFGVLRRGPVTWPFFLEWERRAVRPSTMSARLAPYLRYFSSHRPTDDHGERPSVLVVFDDEIAAVHFLRIALDEMDITRVKVPLWVSHRADVDALGPLGRAWRRPGDPEPAQPLMER